MTGLIDPGPYTELRDYGKLPEFTPLADAEREIEWQKTNQALGRPVDANALFAVIDRINEQYDEKFDLKDKAIDKVQKRNRDLIDAIDQAVSDLDKKVRTRMSEKILGKLNRIDRHDVASLVKELLSTIDEIQTNLRRAKG